MKVIKRVPWSYKFTCATCSSELEAEPADVMYTNWEEGGEYHVKCGVCEDKHIVASEKLPHAVAMEAVRFSTSGVKMKNRAPTTGTDVDYVCHCEPGQKHFCICYTKK